MSEEKNAFREAAIEAISDRAQHLPLGCELLVVACSPGGRDFDLVLPSPESNLNNALDALRRNGLSIDGDNAYKRDLCDTIVGALALGAQNTNPPPMDHWAKQFWRSVEKSALCTMSCSKAYPTWSACRSLAPPGSTSTTRPLPTLKQ
ncbi:hypothetical protein [Pseudomonas sp. 31 R 17]|nr:hypothetical protein [Pseudomonas sp. 31 R 17]